MVDALLKHPNAAQFDIITYVRTEEMAKKVQAAGVNAFSGSLTTLEDVVANSAVVFNLVGHNVLRLRVYTDAFGD